MKANGRNEPKHPLMSIVIPTRNSAKTLGLCLESLKNQTMKDFEIIIVDKPGTDKTREIAESFDARYIVSDENPPGARNAGFSAAKGSVFLSIDSDMVLEDRLLEEVARMMAGLGGCDVMILTEIGYGNDFISRCKDLEKRCYIGDELVEAARAFSRGAFEASGGYDPGLFFGEDWDLFFRMKERCRRIGRTERKVMHNTKDLSLLADLRKAYKYGTTLSSYTRKNPSHAVKAFSPSRFFFIRHSGKLIRDPLHALGLVFIKGMEYSAGFAGFLGVKIRRSELLKEYLLIPKIILTIENWDEHAGSFFGLVPSTDRIRLRNGLVFKIRSNDADAWVVSEVFARKVYTPPGFRIREDEDVIDIGAHIGSFSILAASFAKKGRVISYEPFPESFSLLQENIRINGFHNIEVKKLGVSGKRRKMKLNILKGAASCNSMYQEGTDSLEIECVTLADILQENKLDQCGFLKIDCEGAEYGILMDSDPSTLARIDRIAMEYHDSSTGFKAILGKDENHLALKEFLEKNGFTVNVRPSMMYAKRQDPGGGIRARLAVV